MPTLQNFQRIIELLFQRWRIFLDLFQPQIHHHLLHPQGAKAQFIHLVNILKIDINQPIECTFCGLTLMLFNQIVNPGLGRSGGGCRIIRLTLRQACDFIGGGDYLLTELLLLLAKLQTLSHQFPLLT